MKITIDERDKKIYDNWCRRAGAVHLPINPENRNPFVEDTEKEYDTTT